MSNQTIPTIDLSTLFINRDNTADGIERCNVEEAIKEACSLYGFFQIVNHGIPLSLLSRAMELSKSFFAFPDDEKMKYAPGADSPLPAGYCKQPQHSPQKNEYLLMFPPDSKFNVLPSNPLGFRQAMEELFPYLAKTGEVIERLVNDCLGLPDSFLKEFNDDRNCDLLVAFRYFPAGETENIGLTEHKDVNLLSLVVQDQCEGLQVQLDGEWIPLLPLEGALVVNIGDVLQVLTNNKFMSATHRVVRPKVEHRHSFAFFYNLEGEKWVEPLPQFTEEVGQLPKYRGFFYKDYQALRMKNLTHPPSRLEDMISITHYALPTS